MQPVDRVLAPAKLTRALRVLGVRPDGYHLLETEMVSLDLADELEIEEGGTGLEVLDEVAWSGGAAAGADRLYGPSPAGAVAGSAGASGGVPSGGDNLVVRALAAAGRQARVKLRKRIPAGAGLGGGSSDAAAVLRWAGVLDTATAARLGADVPFCVLGGRARVGGIGDIVEPLGFEAFTVVLVTPALSVATPEVYRAWDALGGPHGGHDNDLEPAAVVVEPRLLWWRELISGVAGERPRLAGSGGSWYLEPAPEAARKLRAEIEAAVLAAGARAMVAVAASTPGQ
jgi:4-diphosphocytidyl-2-C-methyl-D-erythritol kinase